ncbi:MAG: sigma-70 family RNA polymerase sigma factor [Verrucomicrobiota bacterium]
MDGRSDEELVAAINAGDAAAFEVLYRRHRDWVVNLAFRFTGDRELALDVLQETFLYFLKKFPGFTLTARLQTFLYPAVKNLSIGAQRKARRLESNEPAVANVPAPEPAVEGASAREELAAALATLSEEHREVLLLRFVDDLSLNEIAGALEVPLGTVKSRLHHALGALRRDSRTKKWFG